MALTPDELSTISVWHEQFVQRDPTLPWGRALEERFLGIADEWEALLERHKTDGVRSTLHVEQVDASLMWLRTRRRDLQEARTPPAPSVPRRETPAPAQAKEDEKPAEQPRDARGHFQGQGPQRR